MCEIVAAPDKSEPPPKKRSLFSKQALAKVSVANDPVDFFSRAKKVYPQLLEEEERKRQSKIRKIEIKQALDYEDLDKNAADKKTISTDNLLGFARHIDNDQHVSNQRINSKSPCDIKPQSSIRSNNDCSAIPYDTKYERNTLIKNCSTPNPEIAQQSIINLDSDDEEICPSTASFVQRNSLGFLPSLSPSAERQDELSDEEFSEFIQQAREREKLKAQQRLNITNIPGDQNPGKSVGINADVFETDPKSAEESDPTIEILITCELEGTRPLRVKRKLSQRLKEARLTWCDKQQIRTDLLGRPLEDVVFFTWRGKRLFDATTCGSLGLNLSEDKTSLSKNNAELESRGNIHLEVWTEDALKAKETKTKSNQRSGDKGYDERDIEIEHKGKVPSCRLILKAKDMEPFKLVVKPTTTVSKMADAFRKARAIPEGTAISLRFDGDVLDPDSTIEDTELGDLDNIDTVEVYLK